MYKANWKAIIVDDESSARDLLSEIILLEELPVEILDKCANLPEAIKSIRKNQPEIVFMDIEMPKYSGLQVADFKEDSWDFELIFTTAYNKYAIDALRVEASDYLLKPIQGNELRACLERLENKRSQSKNSKIYLTINGHKESKRIKTEEILFIEASGMYSTIVMQNEEQIMASKPLKNIEELLPENFMRIHRSYIVNLDHVHSISNLGENTITLSNENKVPIAKKNRVQLKKKILEKN